MLERKKPIIPVKIFALLEVVFSWLVAVESSSTRTSVAGLYRFRNRAE